MAEPDQNEVAAFPQAGLPAFQSEMHPASEFRTRRPGAMRGQIRMADDFDALPTDMLAAMESDCQIGPADGDAP